MESKKYVIKDLFHKPKNYIRFVNDDTKSLEDIWITNWPQEKEKNPEDYRPLVFDDLKTAKRYLTEIKRESRIEWTENSHIHKRFGYEKPQWDIYDYVPAEVSNEVNG